MREKQKLKQKKSIEQNYNQILEEQRKKAVEANYKN